MITQQQADQAAQIIVQHTAKTSETACTGGAWLTNDTSGFWLKIVIGRCPYNQELLTWKNQITNTDRETLYAHQIAIRISEDALIEDENPSRENHKLKQVAEALSDIWWESRHFAQFRRDRLYQVPYGVLK